MPKRDIRVRRGDEVAAVTVTDVRGNLSAKIIALLEQHGDLSVEGAFDADR